LEPKEPITRRHPRRPEVKECKVPGLLPQAARGPKALVGSA